MTLVFDVPAEIEEQLVAAAQAQGVPVSYYVRDFLIERHREDAEDISTASQRPSNLQRGLTSSELRRRLHLDD
jgi:predicted DNA-binding protein